MLRDFWNVAESRSGAAECMLCDANSGYSMRRRSTYGTERKHLRIATGSILVTVASVVGVIRHRVVKALRLVLHAHRGERTVRVRGSSNRSTYGRAVVMQEASYAGKQKASSSMVDIRVDRGKVIGDQAGQSEKLLLD